VRPSSTAAATPPGIHRYSRAILSGLHPRLARVATQPDPGWLRPSPTQGEVRDSTRRGTRARRLPPPSVSQEGSRPHRDLRLSRQPRGGKRSPAGGTRVHRSLPSRPAAPLPFGPLLRPPLPAPLPSDRNAGPGCQGDAQRPRPASPRGCAVRPRRRRPSCLRTGLGGRGGVVLCGGPTPTSDGRWPRYEGGEVRRGPRREGARSLPVLARPFPSPSERCQLEGRTLKPARPSRHHPPCLGPF